MQATLTTQDLNLTIGGKNICSNLNLAMQSGELWLILGCNGSGKTTLLHTLAGLRKAQQGNIRFNNKPLGDLSRIEIAQQIGILLQKNSHSFPATLEESVLAGRYPHLNRWQMEQEYDLNIAQAALKTMQLTHLAKRNVETLSGGELQRLRLATLLTQAPEIYMLDEPLTNLDPRYQILVLHTLKDLFKKQNKLVIVIAHEIHLFKQLNPRLLMLFQDGNVQISNDAQLLEDPAIINALYQIEHHIQ